MTTATKILIVYSKSQNARRRLIKCDHDDHYVHHQNIHPNEGWMEIPLETYNSFGCAPEDIEFGNTLDVHIARMLGNPKNDRCAIVCDKTGVCLHIVRADPEIDLHPDGEIIAHETLAVGEKP